MSTFWFNKAEKMLITCFLTLFFLCGGSCWRLYLDSDVRLSSDDDWDQLKLTRSWPPSVCIFLENDGKKCHIANFTKSWMIHGLWPTKSGTKGPNYCHGPEFNETMLEVLRPTLDYNWPSIAMDDKPVETWDHEWWKHGRCAALLPTIGNELGYFNLTLGLHFTHNLTKYLQQGQIIPAANKTYDISEIVSVLNKALGVKVHVSCVKKKDTDDYHLEQVEVCFNKTFQAVDCSDPSLGKTAPLHDLRFHSERSFGYQENKVDRTPEPVGGCGSTGEVYFTPITHK